MSILSTKRPRTAPSAANALTVTAGGSAWANGSWVQFIASAADDLALHGLTVSANAAGNQAELEIGIGGAGSEVPIGVVRLYLGNSTGGGVGNFEFPIAIGGIAAGDRVAIRARSAGASTAYEVALQYVEDPDSDQVTTSPLASAPAAASHATVTPSGTAWVNTAWVQLTSGLADPSGLAGFAIRHGVQNADYEIDIGIGGAGSEVVITTIKNTSCTSLNSGGNKITAMLAAVYLLAASTRIAYRLRKSGTDTTQWGLALIYYGNLQAPVTERTSVLWY